MTYIYICIYREREREIDIARVCMYVYIYRYMYIYIYMYTYMHSTRTWVTEFSGKATYREWILCRGGCSGRGVQWIWVVLYSKLAYNVI